MTQAALELRATPQLNSFKEPASGVDVMITIFCDF
jgi:hypothetical protein